MRISFTAENKVNQREDFPRLKLEQQDEKARVWLPEDPIAGYVHNLRAPKIADGRHAFEVKKDKDGNDRQVPLFDFISRPLCLGQPSILEEDGLDPKNCPACREAKKSDIVDAPQRRFSMHVVRYATNTNGIPSKPLQASVYVWSFTDFMFNKLVDIAMEYGGLTGIDLILTLKTKQYQQYELLPSPNSLRQDPAVAKLLDEIYAENKAKDLLSFCGMNKKADLMEGDIEKIKSRWDMVRGMSAAAAPVATVPTASLDAGLSDLLGGSSSNTSAPTATTSVEPTTSLEDLFNAEFN